MSRRLLFRLCGQLGLPAVALRGCRALPALWLTVLAYHRVCECDPSSPWDPDVVSATPDGFRRQLEFVKRHFSPITSEQLVLWSKGRFKMPANPVVLTFDDGYCDNYSIVLPLLLEAKLTADFFVCPWNIESKRVFWWDKIACYMRASCRPSITLTYPAHLELDLGSAEAVDASRHALLRAIKHTERVDLERVLDELLRATEASLDEPKEAERLLMGWEQIRALRRAGMGVGSHSYSHPLLDTASEEVVRKELIRSKSVIETHIAEPVFALAYPLGRLNDGTKSLAREAGYELAYSYCSGASRLRSADLLDIRRVAVERHMSLPYFKTMAAVPFLA